MALSDSSEKKLLVLTGSKQGGWVKCEKPRPREAIGAFVGERWGGG